MLQSIFIQHLGQLFYQYGCMTIYQYITVHTLNSPLLNTVLVIILYQFCVLINVAFNHYMLLIVGFTLKFISHDRIFRGHEYQAFLLLSSSFKVVEFFPFIWIMGCVELWLLIDRCGILSVRAFKMHNTYFRKQLLLWQLSGHLQLSLHDWLLMESNMLEKRIE